MDNLAQSIAYTREKKQHQLSKLEERRKDNPVSELKGYLLGDEKQGSAGLNLEYLSNWHHWRFIHDVVIDNDVNHQHLVKSTYFAMESNNWRFFLGRKVERYNLAIPLTNSIKHLAQLLYLGQQNRAIDYGNLLLKMLYAKQYDGGLSFPTHPWFMLELFCKWQGKTLEQDGTRYPDSLGAYQAALDNWDTTDTQLLSDMVDTLTDFHIAQSDEDVTTDEYGNEFSPEFTSSNYFIFPIEILMWLAIRREKGLPEYTPSTSNALMQMEINQLPNTVIPFEKDELIEKCKAKLKADNPTIDFEL